MFKSKVGFENQTLIFPSGQLSKTDIMKEMKKDNGLTIHFGVNSQKQVEARMQPASYDISPSFIAMSTKCGMLEKIYKRKSQYIDSYYIYVKPKDTVLIVSNEFICLPNYITGYLTSRVSNVSLGFGHISTTIDPNWKGAILIGLSNPTNQPIKINVGEATVEDATGKATNLNNKTSLATLTFHYLSSPIDIDEQKRKSMRTDLLNKAKYTNKLGVKAKINKFFMVKRKKLTNYFFEYLEAHEEEMLTQVGWSAFLERFSKLNIKQDYMSKPDNYIKRKPDVSDFIIKENIFNRARHFILCHKTSAGIFGVIIAAFVLTILYVNGILPKEIYSAFFELISFK